MECQNDNLQSQMGGLTIEKLDGLYRPVLLNKILSLPLDRRIPLTRQDMRRTNTEVSAGKMYVGPVNDKSDAVNLCLSAGIESERIRKNLLLKC
jgi:hypothetical protein